MNTIFQLVFSTVLLLQLGSAAHIPPLQKLVNTGTTTNRRALSRQIFENFVEKYEPATDSEDLQSHTCVYYNYLDECHNTNDGCGEQTETCSAPNASTKTCFTFWDGNKKLLQGCWYPPSPAACKPGACVANTDYVLPSGGYERFCCCFGDKCNEHYSVGNHILDWA